MHSQSQTPSPSSSSPAPRVADLHSALDRIVGETAARADAATGLLAEVAGRLGVAPDRSAILGALAGPRPGALEPVARVVGLPVDASLNEIVTHLTALRVSTGLGDAEEMRRAAALAGLDVGPEAAGTVEIRAGASTVVVRVARLEPEAVLGVTTVAADSVARVLRGRGWSVGLSSERPTAETADAILERLAGAGVGLRTVVSGSPVWVAVRGAAARISRRGWRVRGAPVERAALGELLAGFGWVEDDPTGWRGYPTDPDATAALARIGLQPVGRIGRWPGTVD